MAQSPEDAWKGPEQFGLRLRAELMGASKPENGKPIEHLRQLFEYHKHSDWMFLQRMTVAVTLNLGFFALYAGIRQDLWPIALLVVVLGFVTTRLMQRWTQRLDKRMVEIAVYLEEDPVFKEYVDSVDPKPPMSIEERRKNWGRKRLHYTPVYALYAGWTLAGLVSLIALVAWLPRAYGCLRQVSNF